MPGDDEPLVPMVISHVYPPVPDGFIEIAFSDLDIGQIVRIVKPGVFDELDRPGSAYTAFEGTVAGWDDDFVTLAGFPWDFSRLVMDRQDWRIYRHVLTR